MEFDFDKAMENMIRMSSSEEKANESVRMVIMSTIKAYLGVSDLHKLYLFADGNSPLEELIVDWSDGVISEWKQYHKLFSEDEKNEIYEALEGRLLQYSLRDIASRDN